MRQDEVFELVIRILEKAEFQYMVCGSVAAILYGEPRLTNDMDLVIATTPQRAREFFAEFDKAGFYCPPPEILEQELRQRGQFNLLHQESGVKVDCIVLKEDSFHREEFRRKRRYPLSERQEANLARPEDVVLAKLQYFREGGSEKHIADIRGILRISHDEIDSGYLEQWIKSLGLEAEWQKVKST